MVQLSWGLGSVPHHVNALKCTIKGKVDYRKGNSVFEENDKLNKRLI